VVRIPVCKPRGLGFDSQRYQIFFIAMDLKWGPLSLVRLNDELLRRKTAAPVYKPEINYSEGSTELTR
jgi:hypothetical protein